MTDRAVQKPRVFLTRAYAIPTRFGIDRSCGGRRDDANQRRSWNVREDRVALGRCAGGGIRCGVASLSALRSIVGVWRTFAIA